MKPRIQDGPGPTEDARPALNQPTSLNRQVRNWLRQTKALRWLDKNDAILSFKDLYVKESRQLGDEVDAKAVSVVTGTAGEPWVAFTPKDRFGLALSGGGIRSATFNLGLLQALAQLGVLRQVNYLSTVSGGGYVGGFWTAWLRRCGDRAGEDRFPLDHERRGCEQAEVRHLREFSRFLLPRAGVLETEFWGIAMTILGGLIPSLLAALAVLVIGWYFWALLLASLTMESFWSARVMGVSLLVYLVGAEFWWGWSGKSEHNERETWGYCAGCGIGLTLAFIGWAVRERWLPGAGFDPSVALLEPSVSFAPSVLLGVCTLALLVVRLLMARFYRTPAGISVLVGVERALTRFLGLTSTVTVLAALWVVAGLMADAAHGWGLQITAGGAALSAALFAWAKKWLTSPPQETHGGNLFSTALKWLKRATPKLLAGLVWLLLFLLVGAGVQAWGIRYAGLYSWPFWSLLGGSLGILGLAAWLFDPARVGMHEFYRSRISRCYLGASNFDGTRAQPEHERAASNRFTNERPGDDLTLKELPGSPFLSTHEVKASALAKRLREQNDAVSRFLWNELSAPTRKHLAAGSDPGLESESNNAQLVEELNRILGASSMYEAQRFAQTSLSEATRRLIERNVALDPDERARLNRLLLEDAFPEQIARNQPLPLHLVCVAANDMSGDRLGTLYRGARSAVLSVNGISLGDDTAKLDDLRFSAALTASAAAFNSQMGRISIDLGPAVTFLMSALNLRLGLWVPHPSNRRRGDYLFPGRFFLFELLGRSRTTKKHLHLSDGDHFENFGLYELIRRHCRYIIVSDCGADPEVAFDDLANVLRRVREDFGVEIELDVSPLRPGNDGLARQHAVVGTIHYNSSRGMDKGTILFFKPALTGDEPADVLQYRTRNRSFPHETTSDQFYDEAQWESYRRLGEHVGHVVLDFFEQLNVRKRNLTDRLFRDARSFWHPAPPHQHEDFLNLTDRCASLEADLTANGPSRLRNEFFAEAVELATAGASMPASSGRERPAVLPDPNLDEELRSLAVLLRVLQIMEDVWLAADLDHYWSHPLNQGWMNYFQRWASTPSFRRWWPILGPIYSPGFREFAKARFAVGVRDAQAKAHGPSFAAAGLELREIQDRAPFLASNLWLQFKQRRPAPDLSGRSILAYELDLLDYNGNPGGVKLQVGFVLVEELRESDAWIAKWKAEEFFVPPAMHGVGIVSHLLDAVVRHFQTASGQQPPRSFSELRVQFGTTPPGQPPAGQKPRAAGRAARLERVREIEFYKSRGFRYVYQEDPKTGAIALSRDLQPQE